MDDAQSHNKGQEKVLAIEYMCGKDGTLEQRAKKKHKSYVPRVTQSTVFVSGPRIRHHGPQLCRVELHATPHRRYHRVELSTSGG